jgi:hypothetical protein
VKTVQERQRPSAASRQQLLLAGSIDAALIADLRHSTGQFYFGPLLSSFLVPMHIVYALLPYARPVKTASNNTRLFRFRSWNDEYLDRVSSAREDRMLGSLSRLRTNIDRVQYERR